MIKYKILNLYSKFVRLITILQLLFYILIIINFIISNIIEPNIVQCMPAKKVNLGPYLELLETSEITEKSHLDLQIKLENYKPCQVPKFAA